MPLSVFHVDAFTAKPFAGNPAAVCPLAGWLDDELLRAVAAENNLSETAYLVPCGDDYELRWFTPRCEAKLCGHATLASAFVVLKILRPSATWCASKRVSAVLLPFAVTAICSPWISLRWHPGPVRTRLLR
jgi:PhzF family phenazine biosynthesis protein